MDPPGPGPGSKPRPKPDSSSVSLKSDDSKDIPPDFRDLPPKDQSTYNMGPSGPGPRSKPRPKPAPSFESLKSDRSKSLIIHFGGASADDQSDHPKDWHPDFRELPPEEQRELELQEQLDAIFTCLEESILTFVKEQLQRFHRLLVSEYPETTSESEEEQSSREAMLNITLDFLRRMKQEQLAKHLRNRSSVGVCRDKVKSRLQQRFSSVFEGVAKAGNSAPLHQIYTELSITQGGDSEVNQEHEIRHIETTFRKPAAPETSITCENLFKRPAHPHQQIKVQLTQEGPIGDELTEDRSFRAELTEEYGTETMTQKAQNESVFKKALQRVKTTFTNVLSFNKQECTEGPMRVGFTEEDVARTVLTKGVAGVGKTVLTQKFSLDWAESRANQDIDLLFPFTFRELNVLRETQYSLVELLHHFFSETKGLCSLEDVQVLFIFDGLDECRFPLDFKRTRVLTDPTETASVEELLVNLIRGDLLPFAHVWITTRPAAANQIPAECVSMVTDVRGFSDSQKELYFRKRFSDEQQATDVISHIKSIHSLYIMCYIPVFCWILSTVLLHLMKTRKREELPYTLTQMYIHFLVVQAKVKNIKYHGGSGTDLHWTKETIEMVWSLGKLAFEQLMKGNLIFYESDLRECDLDAAEIARYSGVFTEVFREEPGLYQNKVYCYIHLTVQEFLSALHVHEAFFSFGENLLFTSHISESPESDGNLLYPSESPKNPEDFYRSAVDLALQSPNGHLDLFLRFLLGLSLPTNQSLLSGLLIQTGSESTKQETVKYIKMKLNEKGLSAERSLNLLHCLNELNDYSLKREIQKHMKEGRVSLLTSPAEWSALSFLLLSSDTDLEEFDLRNYQGSQTALLGLLPVVKASTKATLSGCALSSLSCGPLGSILSSSSLTFLNLSNNDLQDSGVELLCSGLKNTPCRLHTLRLSGCLVSERGGASLVSALSSALSHLRELDLSYNHLGPSAELLTTLCNRPHAPLDSLRLDPAGEQWMVPGLRKYSCEFSLDPNTAHRNLRLWEDKRTVIRMREEQQYPHHEDKFIDHCQVLSSTGLRGRCYWEVKWCGRGVEIAVSYKGIRRRGLKTKSKFGDSDQSWSLRFYGVICYVCHNKRETHCTSSTHSGSGKVGVFLDSEAGALSFYEVRHNGELFHLHTFFSSFTEPLYPGLGLWDEDDFVSLVDLNH